MKNPSGVAGSWWPVLFAACLVVAGGITALRWQQGQQGTPNAAQEARVGCVQLARAFSAHSSGQFITVAGVVSRTLPDQFGRFRHQRFVARCARGLTVLVVNDVSIGQRAPVKPGDPVVVRGQYVWNSQGGLIHYTHHGGPGGLSGWILLKGKEYAWTKFGTKRWKTAA